MSEKFDGITFTPEDIEMFGKWRWPDKETKAKDVGPVITLGDESSTGSEDSYEVTKRLEPAVITTHSHNVTWGY